MRSFLNIITVRGVPVRLHYTWLLVALIATPLLTTVTIPAFLPDAGGPARVVLALLVLVVMLGSVVVHELAHLLIARLMQIRFPVMNLYPLGAITRLPDRYGSPGAAFWTAAAGPLASIAFSWVLSTLAGGDGPGGWHAVVLYIGGQFSFYLGLINLLPGLPLDGGRMLRAVLRLVTGSFETATRAARMMGLVIAYGLVFFGAIRLIGAQEWLSGGALVLVGWAVREAGGTAHRRSLVVRLLNQLTAKDVLSRPERAIGPEQSLHDYSVLIRGRTGNQPTPVLADGTFLGLIDREMLRAVPQGYWETRTVAETMAPAASLTVIGPATPVSMLLPHLASDAIAQQPFIAVVQEGRLLGMIDADELLALLELEDEFGLFSRERLASQRVAALPVSQAAGRAFSTSDYTAHERAAGQ